MIVNTINSKWSMKSRFMLISALFLIPSLVQFVVYLSENEKQISVAHEELFGGAMANAVWGAFSDTATAPKSELTGEFHRLLAERPDWTDVRKAYDDWSLAKSPTELAQAGVGLMHEIAEHSGMMLDPAGDSYFAQDLLTSRIPELHVALHRLDDRAKSGGADVDLTDIFGRVNSRFDDLKRVAELLATYDKSNGTQGIILPGVKAIEQRVENLQKLLSAANYKAATLPTEFESERAAVHDELVRLGGEAGKVFVEATNNRISAAWRATLLKAGLLLLASIGGAIFALLVGKGSTARLAALADAMTKVSEKNAQIAVPCIDDANENGRLAMALEHFRLGVLENERLTQEAVEQAKLKQEEGDYYVREHQRFMSAFTDATVRIAAGDFSHRILEKVIQEYEPIIEQMNLMMGKLESGQREKQAADEQVIVVVSTLGTALSALSEGNLEVSFDSEVEPEFEKLKEDFNAAVGELRSTLNQVKKGAGSIKLGTDEISQASDDLSRRTEQQAASLEETAAALDEITATVSKTAEGANHARQTVTVAKADAEKGGEVVRQRRRGHGRDREVVAADQPDHRRHRRDRLPDQPAGAQRRRRGGARRRGGPRLRGRRLGSARAGPALGRSRQGDQGPDLGLDRAGRQRRRAGRRDRQGAARASSSQVAEINELVTEIAARRASRRPACSEVNTAVNQMDQVTQQNAAMVEESTAATQSLAHETQDLARLVGKFRTGAEDTAADSSRSRKRDPWRGRTQPVRPKWQRRLSPRSVCQFRRGLGGVLSVAQRAKASRGADV